MKKKLLTIAVTAAMVLSLVACGSNGGNNETKVAETSGSETAAESVVSESNGENTLKAGATTGFFGAESLDPANNWDGWIMSIYGISENLFRLDDNLAPQPWLVDSYENTDNSMEADGQTLTIHTPKANPTILNDLCDPMFGVYDAESEIDPELGA